MLTRRLGWNSTVRALTGAATESVETHGRMPLCHYHLPSWQARDKPCQRRARVHARRNTPRLTPLHHRSHWSATSTPPKRPQTSPSNRRSLRPGWPRSNLHRRAIVPVAGTAAPKMAARRNAITAVIVAAVVRRRIKKCHRYLRLHGWEVRCWARLNTCVSFWI